MLDITGAGAQLPMRSHWKSRPGPQSHKNSEQQCKRIRATIIDGLSRKRSICERRPVTGLYQDVTIYTNGVTVVEVVNEES